MLHIYSPTPAAILLLGARRHVDDVLRFPIDGQALPGLFIFVQPLLPINDQLLDRAAEILGLALRHKIEIVQEFADPLVLADGSPATLYLARLEADIDNASWPNLPDILRGLPRDRSRLPYLRAWQVLSGGLQLNTKAIEVEDVEKHFET